MTILVVGSHYSISGCTDPVPAFGMDPSYRFHLVAQPCSEEEVDGGTHPFRLLA